MTEFFVESAYKKGLEQLGLTTIESVFAFQGVKNLAKANLAPHRSRIEFKIDSSATTLFLKRYNRPPVSAQVKNWLSAKKQISSGFAEFNAAKNMAALGINTPKMVAWGESRRAGIFEKRSFVIIAEVPDGVSLEKGLPDFFNGPPTPENLKMRRRFIEELAEFIRKFHDTGFRHRDLYLCHIFRVPDGRFFLIDLARVFKPMLFGERFRVKDLAQLNYSAPARYFSRADRMRFYLAYMRWSNPTPKNKSFIGKIIRKTGRIAHHDAKRADYNTAL
jgi:heptose I phosphotransferase